MSVNVLTHLNFAGNAREALEFYQFVFGGQLSIGTYGQGGIPRDSANSDQAAFEPVPADSPYVDYLSFGLLVSDSGFRLAAYDVYGARGAALASTGLSGATRRQGLTHNEPFFVVLNGDTRDDIDSLWSKLAVDGTVIQALAPSDFSPAYGMLTDRYGVTWIFGAMS